MNRNMLFFGVALSVLMLAGCTPKVDRATDALFPEPSQAMKDSFAGCTWGRVSGASLELWAYACDVARGDVRIVADDSLPGFVETSGADGAPRRVVVQEFAKPAEAPIDAVLDAVRAASPGPSTAGCVLVPATFGGAPGRYFTLEPTGEAKAAWDAAEAAPSGADAFDPPCGEMGPATVGDRYFEVLPDDPKTVVFVELGSEIQIFDPNTIRAKESN